jgi:hypothetical protein
MRKSLGVLASELFSCFDPQVYATYYLDLSFRFDEPVRRLALRTMLREEDTQHYSSTVNKTARNCNRDLHCNSRMRAKEMYCQPHLADRPHLAKLKTW